MKGDFTRVTFDPARHFSRVLMQQGRVLLDADYNEQTAILLHYIRTLAADLIGPYCGPPGEEINFDIYPDAGSPPSGEFRIGVGHYYVDGLLVENGDPEQRFEVKKNRDYFVYLDVWERHITRVQDSLIREVALGAGGPDTCTRAEVVWRIRLHDVGGIGNYAASCDSAHAWVEKLRALELPEQRPRMRAQLNQEGQSTDACSIPPDSRYRGMENQLYRIEVHRGGELWDGVIGEKGVPGGNAADAATFKWSRDNGSVVFPIVRREGDLVYLEHLGRDRRSGLSVDDWVEIMDDGNELEGEPGILAQVKEIDSEKMTVTLAVPDGKAVGGDDYDEESTTHPLLRRWDQRRVEGLAMDGGAILISSVTVDGGQVWIEIEDGIEVAFTLLADGAFRTGDYWLIPARVVGGGIEWPTEGEEPVPLPPRGIEHHYAPLAVITANSAKVEDCRSFIKTCCNEKPGGES